MNNAIEATTATANATANPTSTSVSNAGANTVSMAKFVSATSCTGTQISLAPVAVIPIDELESQITELAGHLNAANHRLLLLIAEFDRREGWGDGSTKSCAHWLNWRTGIDLGAAREKVRVARALEIGRAHV